MESELALVNKVEFRIALANDEVSLQNALKLYLPPLLLKLASPHGQVRQAILKIIQDLIPRISVTPSIKLPVDQLLAQVSDPKVPAGSDAISVQLYSLIFITKFIDRFSAQECLNLLPMTLKDIHKRTPSVAARLFYLICRLLVISSFDSLSNDQRLIDSLNWHQTSNQDRPFIAEKIAKFFLLRPGASVNPGLSRDDVLFFNESAGVSYKTSQDLAIVKDKLLRFLTCGVFTDDDATIALLVASKDPSSALKDTAEICFKKLKINYENQSLVDSLISMFLGHDSTPAVDSIVQDAILTFLLKSSYALTHSRISNISKLGMSSDYGRLKQTTVQFIRNASKSVTTNNDSSSIVKFSHEMASQLRESIMSQGWPTLQHSGDLQTAISQRSVQYSALGELLKLNPSLFQNDILYLDFLFQSLESDDPALRSTIQESLSSLSIHLPYLSDSCKNDLKRRLESYLTHENFASESLSSCRYVAIKFVNCTFPFNDAKARYLCILATSKNNRSDVIEEALKGLHPHWYKVMQASNSIEFKSTSQLLGKEGTVTFPTFNQMISTIINAFKVENYALKISMSQAIQFCFQTFVMNAVAGEKTVIVQDEDWSTRLEKAVEFNGTVQDLIKKQIEINIKAHDDSFIQFLNLVFSAFSDQYLSNSILDINFGSTFTLLLSFSPHFVLEKLSSLIPRLSELLYSKSLNDKALIEVSQSLAVIGSNPSFSDNAITSLISQILKNVSTHSPKINMVALSFLYSHLVLRKRENLIDPGNFHHLLENINQSLKDNFISHLALESISQLSVFGALGPHLQLTKFDLSPIILEIKKRVKRCDEKATIALANLSLAYERNSTDTNLDEFEQTIYDSHTSKQTDFMFTSGEALSILAAGWDSTVLKRYLDVQGAEIAYIPKNTSRLDIILNTILKACAHSRPALRKSGCIWLLSLLQFCGHLPLLKESAPMIHVTFMKFLADKDDLIQESASRGLSMVYEMGDRELKDTLVRGLIKSFTDSKSATQLSSGTVDQDTELFTPDLLKTNDGSVSTYKDVLSLASDVGDPSLVYKFMSLAKSSTLWSSRKGIAFGLGSILSKSSLDDLLKSNDKLASRLIPKLYRYKYDPSTSVSTSMNEIWNVLVKDPVQTVKDNFKAILKELLNGMGNKEWRVRQASTTALIDLLQTSDLEVYESQLENIWMMSFRIMDDIKDSVRKEGNKLTKSLSTTLLRVVEKNSKEYEPKEETREILSNLIPFLLGQKGLLSDAEDIRDFALKTILKLVKIGGSSIKEFVPELIDNFISLMSTLEPQVVNYLILNADKYNLKSDDIDAQRLQSIGQSPMMDAIEKLLDSLDDTIMSKTIDRIIQSIKKAVGLPSKVCGSKVLVSLVTRHLQLSKPYGDALLKVALQQISDRNDTVAVSYAAAAGYICRISSLSVIESYINKITLMYFDSANNERNRYIAAIASESVSKYSKDKFESIAAGFLPLAYIGKHDLEKSVREPFEREWIENTSGTSSIKLYLTDIILLSSQHFDSQSFIIRQIIAKSLASAVASIDTIQEFPEDRINQIISLLIEACKGRSWNGKESVFEALVLFASKSEPYLKKTPELREKIDKVVVTEIKRKNKAYQKEALKISAKYIFTYSEEEKEPVQVFTDIMKEIVQDEYEDESDDEDMNVDSENDVQKTIKQEEERLTFIKSVFAAYNTKDTKPNPEFIDLLFQCIPYLFNSSMIKNTWRSKLMGCECLQGVCLKLSKSGVDSKIFKEQILANWDVLATNCLNNKEIENVKLQFLKMTRDFLALGVSNEVNDYVKGKLQVFLELEQSNVVLTELRKII